MNPVDMFGLLVGGIVICGWLWAAFVAWREARQDESRPHTVPASDRLAA